MLAALQLQDLGAATKIVALMRFSVDAMQLYKMYTFPIPSTVHLQVYISQLSYWGLCLSCGRMGGGRAPWRYAPCCWLVAILLCSSLIGEHSEPFYQLSVILHTQIYTCNKCIGEVHGEPRQDEQILWPIMAASLRTAVNNRNEATAFP